MLVEVRKMAMDFFHTNRALTYIEATSSWPCMQGNTQHKFLAVENFDKLLIQTHLMKKEFTYTYLACTLHSMFYNDAGSK